MRKFRLLSEAAQRRYADELHDQAIALRMAIDGGDALKGYLKALKKDG